MKRCALFVLALLCGMALVPSQIQAHDEAEIEVAQDTIRVGKKQVSVTVVGEGFDTDSVSSDAVSIPVTIDLPDTWSCASHNPGIENSSSQLSNAPSFKVVYAHTANLPNNWQAWAPTLQKAVEQSMNIMAWVNPSGSRRTGRTLRFDLGTVCNPQQVDVRAVTLPRAASGYDTSSSPALFRQIESDVRTLLGDSRPSNLMVLVDGVRPVDASGTASNPNDSRPGDNNATQLGGMTSLVYPTGTPSDPFQIFEGEATAMYALARVMVHEALHTLGAVSASAPNGNASRHSNQTNDIMSVGIGADCDGPFGATLDQIDCGGEDYFNPNPAPGSWLANHWNIANSVFLCPISRCAVRSRAPYPRIHASHAVAEVGQTVTFDASATTDEEGDALVRYQWDLNDDGLYEREGVQASHSWPDRGTKTVRLKVTDSSGEFSIQTSAVTIGSANVVNPVPAPIPTPIHTNPSTPNNQNPGAGTSKPAPFRWSFNIESTARAQSAKNTKSKGLAIKGTATKAGTITFQVKLAGKVLASSKVKVKGGRFVIRQKFSASAKKKLAKGKALSVTGRGASGGNSSVSVRLT